MFLLEKGLLTFNQLHGIAKQGDNALFVSQSVCTIAKIMVIHINSCEMSNRLAVGWTDGCTDGCYQAHYLPALWCCAVGNE